MNTPAILIVVFACLYTFTQVGAAVALCSALNRQNKFTVNMNNLLIVNPVLLGLAYLADTYL